MWISVTICISVEDGSCAKQTTQIFFFTFACLYKITNCNNAKAIKRFIDIYIYIYIQIAVFMRIYKFNLRMTVTLGQDIRLILTSIGFRSRLQAFLESSHTEELGYNETVGLSMTKRMWKLLCKINFSKVIWIRTFLRLYVRIFNIFP